MTKQTSVESRMPALTGTPLARRAAVRAAEQSAEVTRIGYADAPGDFSNGEIRFGQQFARFDHAAFNDPLLHGPSGAAAHDRGQVSGRHPDLARHIPQGQPFAVALVDHREYFGQ
jgi:hypothetical protein